MTTTLFALLTAANTITLDGYEVDTVGFVDGGVRLEYGDAEYAAFFLDQVVCLVDGACSATTAVDEDSATDAEECSFTFHVTRLLCPSDLAA